MGFWQFHHELQMASTFHGEFQDHWASGSEGLNRQGIQAAFIASLLGETPQPDFHSD